MVTKTKIIEIMNEWAPCDQAESWDNVGLQLDTKRDVISVAVVLEINLDTFNIIQGRHYDFVVSHHPLIFNPLNQIGHDDWSHSVLRYFIENDIGFYVSHTNLDRANDGVSHSLAQQYELNPASISDITQGYGKVFQFSSPLDLHQIEFKIPVIAKVIPEDLIINSIAFLGGSGKSFTKEIVKQGIDFYITGELGYHDIQYLRQQKKGLFLLGHYQSEVFILNDIEKRLSSLDIDIEIIK